jgi:hypothetical protein
MHAGAHTIDAHTIDIFCLSFACRCHGEFAVGVDDMAGHIDSSGPSKKDPWKQDEQDRVFPIKGFHPMDDIDNEARENTLSKNVRPVLKRIHHDFFEQLKTGSLSLLSYVNRRTVTC